MVFPNGKKRNIYRIHMKNGEFRVVREFQTFEQLRWLSGDARFQIICKITFYLKWNVHHHQTNFFLSENWSSSLVSQYLQYLSMLLPKPSQCLSKHIQNYQDLLKSDDVINDAIYWKKKKFLKNAIAKVPLGRCAWTTFSSGKISFCWESRCTFHFEDFSQSEIWNLCCQEILANQRFGTYAVRRFS